MARIQDGYPKSCDKILVFSERNPMGNFKDICGKMSHTSSAHFMMNGSRQRILTMLRQQSDANEVQASSAIVLLFITSTCRITGIIWGQQGPKYCF